MLYIAILARLHYPSIRFASSVDAHGTRAIAAAGTRGWAYAQSCRCFLGLGQRKDQKATDTQCNAQDSQEGHGDMKEYRSHYHGKDAANTVQGGVVNDRDP